MRRSAVTANGKVARVIVVGSGLAGLSAVLELLRRGVAVLHLSSAEPRRSLSGSCQEGIVAARDAELAGAAFHRRASLSAARLGAAAPRVEQLVAEAPRVIAELAALGVPFSRDGSDAPVSAHSDDGLAVRTVFSELTTGQQAVGALERQVRALGARELRDAQGRRVPGELLLERLEHWDVLGLVQDDQGAVVGVVAFEQRTSKIRAFVGDGVCLATGSLAGLFGIAGAQAAGSGACGAAIRAGAIMANANRIHWEPTCVPGTLVRPLPALLRELGGRLWSPHPGAEGRRPGQLDEAERDYWAEREGFNARSTASAMRKRVSSGVPVYLELSHLDSATLARRAGWALDLVRAFAAVDTLAESIQVVPFPAALEGGLWVDMEADADGIVMGSPRNQATSVPGLYAAGDLDWLQAALGALPGNRISGRIVAGRLAADGLVAYRTALRRSALDLPQSVFDRAAAVFERRLETLVGAGSGTEGPVSILGVLEQVQAAMRRLVEADDRATTLMAELEALLCQGFEAVGVDPVKCQSPALRVAMHWEGLSVAARVVARAAALGQARETDSEDSMPEPPLLLRWKAQDVQCVDENDQ